MSELGELILVLILVVVLVLEELGAVGSLVLAFPMPSTARQEPSHANPENEDEDDDENDFAIEARFNVRQSTPLGLMDPAAAGPLAEALPHLSLGSCWTAPLRMMDDAVAPPSKQLAFSGLHRRSSDHHTSPGTSSAHLQAPRRSLFGF